MSICKEIHLGPYLQIRPKVITKERLATKITCPRCDYIGGIGMMFCGSCGCMLDTIREQVTSTVEFVVPDELAIHEHGGYVFLFDCEDTPDVIELHSAINLMDVAMSDAIDKFQTKHQVYIENEVVPKIESYEVLFGLVVGWF